MRSINKRKQLNRLTIDRVLAAVHDRMPVVLEAQDFDAWLTGGAGSGLLEPAADDVLKNWPVSKRVNSSRTSDEDPTLIDPIELAPAD